MASEIKRMVFKENAASRLVLVALFLEEALGIGFYYSYGTINVATIKEYNTGREEDGRLIFSILLGYLCKILNWWTYLFGMIFTTI